ncbi:hypothetical protein [Agrobacterium vitis]|uniref:Uncharacterized protein n=1 Tax=Agrobacterium vitis TaxID=373 RepID=A0A7K1RDZ6_AGRVI|nr:hypothetical protein [Agrobacterium vitis]MVA56223.1 hypothetical protein [Agrobacterium vitis]
MKQKTGKKISKMKAVDRQFHDRIEPLFTSWGLSRHPNPGASFGPTDHGFFYDFADLRDLSDVKLAGFGIIQPDASLWIRVSGLENLRQILMNCLFCTVISKVCLL